MKEAWGFRYYTVIIPMRDAEAMENALTHFKGSCNCIDPKLKYLHKNSPFKLYTHILWFTSYDAITKETDNQIFYTPKSTTHSFLDIVS